jgi:type I restriction enzyme, S subunit
MAGEWPVAALQDVCETITDGAHLSPKDYVGGLPMASVKDMTRWGIDVKTSRTISPDDFEILVRNGCQPRIGDVLIAKDGATCLDTVCEFTQPDRIVLLSSVAILRPSKGLHSGYLRYYLDCSDTRAMLKAGYVPGSAIPRVVLKDFRRAPIPLPPLATQKAIAGVLGALDDRIELNRRMNATLEAMARALFQSWFVDFDPVRAKLDGGNPDGLDKATAALFPSHLVHDSGAVAPQGWSERRWGDIATLEYGKGLRDYRESGGRYRVYGTNGAIGFHDEALCDGAGIIIGRKGAYRGVHYSPEPFFVIDTAFYLKPKSPIDLRWAYYELLRLDINGMDSGSAIPSTSRDDFYGIPVIVPPAEIQNAFGAIVGGWFAKSHANNRESRTLATLRDTLLPKLLSGELRVH